MATAIRPEVVPAKPEQPDKGASAIADPGPLGLAAFAMTTFVLSVFNANIIGTLALLGVVLPLALFYGGAVQILAGMWEFRRLPVHDVPAAGHWVPGRAAKRKRHKGWRCGRPGDRGLGLGISALPG